MLHNTRYARRAGRHAAIGVLTISALSAALASAALAVPSAVPTAAVGVNAASGVPASVNLANVGKVVISGTAQAGVAVVGVAVDDDGDASTPPVTDTVTLDGASTAEQTWSSASLDLSALDDGTLTVLSSYDTNAPASDPTVEKDTLEPDSPSALPDDATELAEPTAVEISSLDPADQSDTHYTTGTPTAATPTKSDPVVPASLLVSTTEQVKAISFDAAGNPSPVMVMNFTVAAPAGGTPPVTGSGGTPPVTGNGGNPPVVTPPAGNPPVVVPPAKPALAVLRVARVSPAGAEYVTVRNSGTASVDLKGWTLRDRSGHRLTLPHYLLRSGGSVRIYTGSGARAAGRLFLGRRADIWDRHDTVRLFTKAGVRVATLRY